MNDNLLNEDLEKMPFMDSSWDLENRLEDLLGRLTLEEKFKLCAGMQMWYTRPIKRLGIKAFKMTDGPHGVAPHSSNNKECTYFPTGICRAATWNPELSEKFGVAIAQEVREIGYHMILGPGINIHRTPLCGRTFEYQAEDPYLNKIMAVAIVKGIQSQRISACVKHYACNNQETNRFTVSSEISERALQEIYLPAFEATVREADAWSFMTCYNKVNGIYGSENVNLIKERLTGEWGFRGFTVSDWGATVRTTSSESCVNAGLTLEMPRAVKYKVKDLEKAFDRGKFTDDVINENVKRLLRVMFLVGLFDDESTIPSGSRNTPEHQAIARQIAEEGIVLLKNQNNLLPLNINKLKKVAVIGPNANKKMSMGGGSSEVLPPYEITPLEGFKEKCKGKIKIIESASEADIAIIFAGLNHDNGMDCEGTDRIEFDLPLDQIELVNKTVQENSKTVVVLINGSPVGMDAWIDKVPSVVEAWYAGLEAGRAIADVLFGDVSPSGKLPITFPKKLSDSPAHNSRRTYPGNDTVYYDESILVGYRHFDAKNVEPLFPFGHGLSYTSFSYKNFKINKKKMSGDEKLSITVDITNSGGRVGAEVVQIYVQDVESSVERPPKELKGFKKVKLKPGETKTLTFELSKRDLAFYDEINNCWKAESGLFKILVGSSSRDIRLQGEIEYLG